MSLKSEAVLKVKHFLDEKGYEGEIHHTDDTIFTVEDASRSVGAPPEEILKSLIFRVNDRSILLLMSGSNRVDQKKVAQILEVSKSRVKMASPDFVYESFGFQVGGVPPVGYPSALFTIIDEDVFKYDVVWAAAGTDHDFFPVKPDVLREYTEGIVKSVSKN